MSKEKEEAVVKAKQNVTSVINVLWEATDRIQEALAIAVKELEKLDN